MAVLKPKNFSRFPLGYRPRRTMKVPRNFAAKVRRIKKWGARADNENIANVVTVLENMKTYTPKVFRGRGSGKTRKNK